eukprot:GEMP01032087.1.p1 GENE.GEMP01032087.1~~GEMP01032087.1.p1  ORF type:complete len:236 (+),score=45.33 GEMP01032087.1:218-925(+)
MPQSTESRSRRPFSMAVAEVSPLVAPQADVFPSHFRRRSSGNVGLTTPAGNKLQSLSCWQNTFSLLSDDGSNKDVLSVSRSSSLSSTASSTSFVDRSSTHVAPARPFVSSTQRACSPSPPPASTFSYCTESSDREWVIVTKKHKTKTHDELPFPATSATMVRPTTLSLSATAQFDADEGGECVDFFYDSKGQRHNFSKNDKISRNFKERQRIAHQSEKRLQQSAHARGWLGETSP